MAVRDELQVRCVAQVPLLLGDHRVGDVPGADLGRQDGRGNGDWPQEPGVFGEHDPRARGEHTHDHTSGLGFGSGHPRSSAWCPTAAFCEPHRHSGRALDVRLGEPHCADAAAGQHAQLLRCLGKQLHGLHSAEGGYRLVRLPLQSPRWLPTAAFEGLCDARRRATDDRWRGTAARDLDTSASWCAGGDLLWWRARCVLLEARRAHGSKVDRYCSVRKVVPHWRYWSVEGRSPRNRWASRSAGQGERCACGARGGRGGPQEVHGG
mmetsp:Transcript_157238/g.501349  ORF Transcript_157238/g.501349 Transcript_157238/m.501349 type:complete len:265 (-) Transcript_157238:2253-3047(-)